MTADPEEGTDLPRTTRLGDFTLLHAIGAGAEGTVYEARQESLGRLVALKVLAPHLQLNPGRVERFRRGAVAAGRPTHPGLIGVYAVGEHEGAQFIAQELVPGGRTLENRINEARKQPELSRDWYRETAVLFAEVAEAVEAAHHAGVVHRDIKPSNILLEPGDRPRVTDFGLAMMVDDLHQSHSGNVVGTPCYMSPEQVAAKRIGLDHRTDVFSLGSTLYETLTLQRAFDGESRTEVFQKIVLHEPPDARKLRSRVPRDLAVICMAAMEKRPDRRYQTAAELAADLRRHLAGEPIAAQPPGAIVRAGKWMRRHPAASMAMLVFVVVVLALIVVIDQSLQNRASFDAKQRTVSQMGELFVESTRPSGIGMAGYADEVLASERAILEALDDLPEERNYMQALLGRAHLLRGEYAHAGPYLAGALDFTLMREGEDSDGAAEARLELGGLRRLNQQLAEAESLVTKAWNHFRDHHGAGSPKTLAALVELGNVYEDQRRWGEAERLYREYLDGCRLLAGGAAADHLVLEAEDRLGTFLMHHGRFDDAAELLFPAYELAHGTLSKLAVATLGNSAASVHVSLAEIADAEGDPARAEREWAEAERIYMDLMEQQANVLSPRLDPRAAEALKTYNELGRLLRMRGRSNEASLLQEVALAQLEVRAGGDADETQYVRNNLATVAISLGDHVKAERLFRLNVESDERNPMDDTTVVFQALYGLSWILRAQDRHVEAVPYARALVDRAGPHHPQITTYKKMLQSVIEKQQ